MTTYTDIVLDDGYKSIECIATFIDDRANLLWLDTIICAQHVISEKIEDLQYDSETIALLSELRDAFFSKDQLAFGNSVANIYRKALKSYPEFSYNPQTHMHTIQKDVFNMYCCFKFIINSNEPDMFSDHLLSIRNLPFLEKICHPHPVIKFNFNHHFVEKMIHAIYLRCK
jgi:hypothetical protein